MASTIADSDQQRQDQAPSAIRDLDRLIWRNGLIVCWLAVVATLAFSASVSFALSPLSSAEVALVSGLTLAVVVTVGYLRRQQRRAHSMRHQLQGLKTAGHLERYNRLLDLLTVPRLLDSEGDPESIFETIPRVCLNIFTCEWASLMLYNSEGNYLEVQSAAGHSDGLNLGTKQKIGDGIAGWVAEHRKPVVLHGNDATNKYPGLNFKGRGVAAAIVVPIMLGGEFLGVINMSSRSQKVYYDDNDVRALEAFADNVGVCISQVFRARRLEETIDEQQQALQQMHSGGDSC